MEISMEVAQKTNTRLPLWSHHTLGHISEWVQMNIQRRYLHTHVYWSSLHKNQTVKSAEVLATDEWIKYGVCMSVYIYMCVCVCMCIYIHTAHTHHEILFSHKKNGAMSLVGRWMNWDNHAEQDKPSSKGQILHVLTHWWNLERRRWWWWGAVSGRSVMGGRKVKRIEVCYIYKYEYC
jgi:hypothetical protein